MNKLLGQKVICDRKIAYRKTKRLLTFGNIILYEWEIKKIKPIQGLIVGKRIKLNGYWDFYNGIKYFYSTHSIPCYLVSVSMKEIIIAPIASVKIEKL